MKHKDILAIYKAGPEAVITELKERVKLTKEPKRILKKSGYPEGKPYRLRIELALQGEIVERSHCLFLKRDTKKAKFH